MRLEDFLGQLHPDARLWGLSYAAGARLADRPLTLDGTLGLGGLRRSEGDLSDRYLLTGLRLGWRPNNRALLLRAGGTLAVGSLDFYLVPELSVGWLLL